jgi:hypothetical protein
MRRKILLILLLVSFSGAVDATEDKTAYWSEVQRAVDNRVIAASKSIDVLLKSTNKAGPENLRILISFSRPISVDEAIAFALKRRATIDGFGYQVGDNFGYYPIPAGMTLSDARESYGSEVESFLGERSKQKELWVKQLPDEASRNNALVQKKSLEQRLGADGHWSAIVTGLYVNIGRSEVVALIADRPADVVAVEPLEENKTPLPIPIVSELIKQE